MSQNVGDKVRLTCTFSVAGVNTDPATITVKSMTPALVVTTYTYAADPTIVVKSATGIYYYDLTIAAAGTSHVQFAGTGTVVAVEEISVTAAANVIP